MCESGTPLRDASLLTIVCPVTAFSFNHWRLHSRAIGRFSPLPPDFSESFESK